MEFLKKQRRIKIAAVTVSICSVLGYAVERHYHTIDTIRLCPPLTRLQDPHTNVIRAAALAPFASGSNKNRVLEVISDSLEGCKGDLGTTSILAAEAVACLLQGTVSEHFQCDADQTKVSSVLQIAHLLERILAPTGESVCHFLLRVGKTELLASLARIPEIPPHLLGGIPNQHRKGQSLDEMQYSAPLSTNAILRESYDLVRSVCENEFEDFDIMKATKVGAGVRDKDESVEGMDALVQDIQYDLSRLGLALKEGRHHFFDADVPTADLGNSELLRHSLTRAFAHLSQWPAARRSIVRGGGLKLLIGLCDNATSPKTPRYAARCVSNLLLDPDLVIPVIESGWLNVLHCWSFGKQVPGLFIPSAPGTVSTDDCGDSDRGVVWEEDDEPEARTSRNKDDMCGNVSVHLSCIATRGVLNASRSSFSPPLADGLIPMTPLSHWHALSDPRLDVILLHGVRGGAMRTWRTSTDRKNTVEFWPRHWIPDDVPDARILSVKYKADVSHWTGFALPLQVRARDILAKLREAEVGRNGRPVVFIVHSMGGLIVKQLLLQDELDDGFLAKATKAVIFFGTPHRGARLAKVNRPVGFVCRSTPAVNDLREESPELIRLNERYRDYCEKYNIETLSFGETEKTALMGQRVATMIVPKYSADPGFGKFLTVPGNHIGVCKPSNRGDMRYKMVIDILNKAAGGKQ
eukprot:Rmarinus@m.24964